MDVRVVSQSLVSTIQIYGTTSQHWTITNTTKAIVFSQSDLNTYYFQVKLCFIPLNRLENRKSPH